MAKAAVANARIANWVAGGSAVVALVALVFSLISYSFSRAERVVMTFERSLQDQTSQLERWTSTGVVTSWWALLVSNVGDRTVSVTGMDVRLVQAKGDLHYAGLAAGLMGRIQDAATGRLTFPVALEPGHSAKIFVELKVPVDVNSYKLLSAAYPDGNIPSLSAAAKLLASSGVDLFGNPAEAMKDDGGVWGYAVSSLKKQPNFVIEAQTSRGTRISTTAVWYSGTPVSPSEARKELESLRR